MIAYVVGGAVRDELLGLSVTDHDWVVVGATPEQMSASGFRPVGKDFPVFLHPQTHEEYALARTERKSGRGYKGFTVYAAPDVTLEQDLARRDLTINAMARTADGTLIDPFGGRRDLEQGVLRHVSPVFADDPVRILRVARFSARFEFRVADETAALMRAMVRAGEVEHLVAERVWQEFSTGLCEPHPQRMFEVLEGCGALAPVLPEVAAMLSDAARRTAFFAALGRAAAAKASLAVRFTLIAWHMPGEREPSASTLCARLRAPNEVCELALVACRCRALLERAHLATPASLLEVLKRADAFRRRERFGELLSATRLADPRPQAVLGVERLERALGAAAAVDAGAIAAKAAASVEIPAMLDQARAEAIAAAQRG
jgi:tRNA nucleotidyltransferase (CCA-adding enzyme)